MRCALDPADLARAECDAQRIGSDAEPGRAVQDVPPRIQRFVRRRDGGRCCVPGCRASRHLELHHVVPREAGGGHGPENLTLLCDGHHRALHEGKLTITGKAPALVVGGVITRRSPRSRPPARWPRSPRTPMRRHRRRTFRRRRQPAPRRHRRRTFRPRTDAPAPRRHRRRDEPSLDGTRRRAGIDDGGPSSTAPGAALASTRDRSGTSEGTNDTARVDPGRSRATRSSC